MTKRELIEGYLNAEKPYEVCAHTIMGSYMEYIRLESGIMFEDTARMVADKYFDIWKEGDTSNFKGICVREGISVIYEVTF